MHLLRLEYLAYSTTLFHCRSEVDHYLAMRLRYTRWNVLLHRRLVIDGVYLRSRVRCFMLSLSDEEITSMPIPHILVLLRISDYGDVSDQVHEYV